MKKQLTATVILFAITFTTMAQSQQEIELSKTGENHKLLYTLAGNWNFTGKHFLPDPNKPLQFKGTAVRKPIMDGRYFMVETTGEKINMPWSDGKPVNYTDIVIEGYDNKKQKFVDAMIANHKLTGIDTSEGVYDAATKTIVYEGETETEPGKMQKLRSRLKIHSKDSYVLEIYLVNGSQEVLRTELRYTRS